MTSALQLQKFQFGNDTIELFVPDAAHIQNSYRQQLKNNPSLTAPYWSQLWAASHALAGFLANNTAYIYNKKVLELAAGLALPSLVAAQYASEVVCSDYVPEAVALMQQSIIHNRLTNVQSSLIDWNHLPHDIATDVLLLSDINYEPTAFDTLLHVVQSFLAKNTTVILATPQRIMAKPFIEKLLAWCVHQEDITIQQQQQAVATTVLVFKGTGNQ